MLSGVALLLTVILSTQFKQILINEGFFSIGDTYFLGLMNVNDHNDKNTMLMLSEYVHFLLKYTFQFLTPSCKCPC